MALETTLIDAFFQAMARRDYQALRGMLDPKVEWNSAENFLYAAHNPYMGIDAVLGILRQVDEEWEDFKNLPKEILLAGDTAIIRGRYRGKFKATGYKLDAEFVWVVRYSDGKITAAQTYTDTAQFRDAVKYLRVPPPTMTMSG